MTATLFEKYETRRNAYKPGAKWRDKGGHLVKEVQVLSAKEQEELQHKIHFYNDTEFDTVSGPQVVFKILKSSSYSYTLSEGKIVSWSKEYMEDGYEPFID